MPRYINAERMPSDKFWEDLTDKEKSKVLNYLLASPTVDVEEIRHREWKQNPHCKRIYFCSECGRHIEDGSFRPYENFPYCHCGAKMDGKEGE